MNYYDNILKMHLIDAESDVEALRKVLPDCEITCNTAEEYIDQLYDYDYAVGVIKIG